MPGIGVVGRRGRPVPRGFTPAGGGGTRRHPRARLMRLGRTAARPGATPDGTRRRFGDAG